MEREKRSRVPVPDHLGTGGKSISQAPVPGAPGTTSAEPTSTDGAGTGAAIDDGRVPANAGHGEVTAGQLVPVPGTGGYCSGHLAPERDTSRPADGCWPWRVAERPNGDGYVYGPDGKYRGSMTVEKARALVQELNGFDPRVDHAAYQAWRRSKEAAR